MLTVRNIPAEAWPQVTAGFQDLSYEQTLTYGVAAAHRIGAKAEFVVLERDGRPVAAACLRIKTLPGLGRGIAWIASGPLIQPLTGRHDDLGSILTALREHICDKKGHILRLRLPIAAEGDAAALSNLALSSGFVETDRAAAYSTVLIDLKPGEEALMRGLHGKWRNILRSALKNEIKLDRGPMSELSGRFAALYDAVQTVKGFQPDIPPDFYYQLSGPDFDHDVLIAHREGKDLATITVGRAGRRMVYLFGATPEAGRRLNAGYFVIWNAILIGLAEGMETFDLGGIDEESNPDVTRFKRRTGGEEILAPGPFQAQPAGPVPHLVLRAEAFRKWMRR
ncbi:FemAB family protein [Roseovarius tolerans]|uniref:FemAB family protein n=1 Tax=Roseovarius tolerans TaxID=74031 RepID=A0A0L6CQC4_9RHOB|nr:GNAT family N-acetyltransferase [Roseovarius tolerans]KNX39865.1 FemAB family protein [Roseovarius tolerans]